MAIARYVDDSQRGWGECHLTDANGRHWTFVEKKSQAFPRSFPLQALAIRDNKVHVRGNFAVPSSSTSVYLDIEGQPDRSSYYLDRSGGGIVPQVEKTRVSPTTARRRQ